ncbi:MAG: hypothetical protein IJC89_01890 [Clostridia bacterium]|nr:hypothetical protein [Clostridia bacterium]
MLRKIFSPKICIWLIIAALLVSICFVPFTGSYFFNTNIPTGTLLVLLPILLGVVYAILISCEDVKMSEKKKNGFAIAYACIFTVFYILNIFTIIYAIMQM